MNVNKCFCEDVMRLPDLPYSGAIGRCDMGALAGVLRFLALGVLCAGLAFAAEQKQWSNAANDRLLAMSVLERTKVLGLKIGPQCRPTKAMFIGHTEPKKKGATSLGIWSVMCETGRAYAVGVAPKVSEDPIPLTCDAFKAKTGYDCFRLVKSQAKVNYDGDYREIALDDFKLDKVQLIGRKIKTGGFLSQLGDVSVIGSREVDVSPVEIVTSRLTRDQRKALLLCQNRSCQLTVKGIVKRGYSGDFSIIADDIAIR